MIIIMIIIQTVLWVQHKKITVHVLSSASVIACWHYSALEVIFYNEMRYIIIIIIIRHAPCPCVAPLATQRLIQGQLYSSI